MPLEPYPQPAFALLDERQPIWRFMPMKTFRLFIEPGQLYFRRADLFEDDERECLPPDEYVRTVSDRMGSEFNLEGNLETLRKDRQGVFVSCWSAEESIYLWDKFARGGIAVRSRVGLLKAALDVMPGRTMIGRVRYSDKPDRYNVLHFATTKRPQFNREKEVRAFLWEMSLSPRNPYPYDPKEGIAHSVDVPSMVEEIIISPYAPPAAIGDVATLLADHGYGGIAVVRSGFTGHDWLLPSKEELEKYNL